MKIAHKNILILSIAGFLGACGGIFPQTEPPMSSFNKSEVEMYAWEPPDEAVLSARRANQVRLDSLTQEIGVLFVNHATLTNQELAMLKSIQKADSHINNMRLSYGKKVESESDRRARMKKDLEDSKVGFLTAKARLDKIMAIKPPVMFSIPNYNLAIKQFRNGEYNKSLKLLKKISKQKPPVFLQDNIQFAMGSIFYKLKKYPKAIQQFQKVLDSYAPGDKRFISYFMLGVIHNMQGDKSRAIYLLEEALSKHPPDRMRKSIHRLINIVNDEPANATG